MNEGLVCHERHKSKREAQLEFIDPSNYFVSCCFAHRAVLDTFNC